MEAHKRSARFYSFIYSVSHLFIRSFVHSFTHSFIYACMVQKQLAPFAVYEYVCCSCVCACASAWECLRVTTFSFFGSILIFFNPFFFCANVCRMHFIPLLQLHVEGFFFTFLFSFRLHCFMLCWLWLMLWDLLRCCCWCVCYFIVSLSTYFAWQHYELYLEGATLLFY